MVWLALLSVASATPAPASGTRFVDVLRQLSASTSVPIAYDGAWDLAGCQVVVDDHATLQAVADALVSGCALAAYEVVTHGSVLELRAKALASPLDAVVTVPPGRRNLDALVADLRALGAALPGVTAIGANYQGQWEVVVPDLGAVPLRELLSKVTLVRIGAPPPTAGPGGTLVWSRASVAGSDGALSLRVVADRPPPPPPPPPPKPAPVTRPAEPEPITVTRPSPDPAEQTEKKTKKPKKSTD